MKSVHVNYVKGVDLPLSVIEYSDYSGVKYFLKFYNDKIILNDMIVYGVHLVTERDFVGFEGLKLDNYNLAISTVSPWNLSDSEYNLETLYQKVVDHFEYMIKNGKATMA